VSTADLLRDALVARFAGRWVIQEDGNVVRMTHRHPVVPSPRRLHPNPHQLVDRIRCSMRRTGLPTAGHLLPVRWNRDTDLTISAVQALDPWLKSGQPRVWREGFLAQPVVRFTGERDEGGRLSDGFLTSFVNISHVQRIDHPARLADLLDHWLSALSSAGIHAGRLSIHGTLQIWTRPPVAGITLFIDCDGRGLGDAVLLWNQAQPQYMAADIGSGLERLAWYLTGTTWARAAFGDLADEHGSDLLDAVRTATLLLMAGIRPAHRGPGAATRAVARCIQPRLAHTGLSRLVRAQATYWRRLGVTGPSWPHLTTQLEDEVLRPRHITPTGARS
jgi:hypothetical protein